MADQLYNSFADLQELERIRDFILKNIFGKIKEGVADLSKTTFKIDGADSATELKKVLQELKQKEKELADQSKLLTEMQAQLSTLMSKAGTNVRAQSEALKGLGDQLTFNITKQVEYKQKLEDISSQLKKLKQDQELLAKTEGNEEAKKEIDDRIQKLEQERLLLKIITAELEKQTKEQARRQLFIPGKDETSSGKTVEQLPIEEIRKLTVVQDDNIRSREDLLDVSARLKIESDLLSEEFRQLKSNLESGAISQDEYRQGLADIKERQTAVGVATESVNKSLKNQEKQFQSSADSTDALRAELNQLIQLFDALSPEKKVGDVGQTLKNRIKEVDQQVKELEGSTGRFQRRVGDYANQLAGGFERVAAEIAKLKREQAGLNNFKNLNPIGFKLSGGDDRLNQVDGALKQLNATAQIGYQTTGNLNQQVRQLEQSYQNMAVSGNQSNEFLNEFKNFVAQSKDQLQDLRGEIKALSSDTFVFDQVSQGVKFLASSGQITLSVMELVGNKNEDVQKSIQRLIIIQNVANGVQEIANQLTLRGTILNKAYVFVQGLVSTALNTSATAQARFAATFGLLGIAATIIGAVVIAYNLLNRTLSATERRQKALNDVMSESKQAYVDAVTLVKTLESEIEAAKKGFISKTDVVKHYNETIGKTTGEVKTLDEAEQALVKNGPAFIQLQFQKAIATAAFAKSANVAVDAQLKATQRQAEIDKLEDGLAKLKAVKNETTRQEQDRETVRQSTVRQKRRLAQLKAEAKEETDLLNNIGQDALKLATELSKQFKIDFFGDGGDQEKDKKFFADSLEFRRDAFLKIANDEKRFIAERIAARRAAAEIEAQILKGRTDAEVANAKGNKQEIQLIRSSEAIELKRIKLKSNDDILKIEEDFYKKLHDTVRSGELIAKEAKKQLFEEQVKDAEQLFNVNKLDIESFYSREQELNEAAFRQGKKSAEQYADDKKKIQQELSKGLIDAEIVFTQTLIGLRKLQGQDTTEDERKLLKLKQDLRAIDINNYEEYAKILESINKKIIADRKALMDKLKDQIQETSFKLLEGIYDSQINKIHQQIDAIDELKAAEIDRISTSTESEEKRAAKIAIVEAKAQGQKEALQRRQEQMEKRKVLIQKAAQAFEVTVGGIKDVARIKSEAAVAIVAAQKLPPPFNGIMSAVIKINEAKSIGTVIASTALGLAGILATTPKFKEGKNKELSKQQKDNYEGPAIVGDGGKKEVIIREDGKVELTPDKPTLTNVKKKDIILPDAKKVKKSILEKVVPLPLFKTGKHVKEFEKLKEVSKHDITFNNTSETSDTKREKTHSVVMTIIKAEPHPATYHNRISEINKVDDSRIDNKPVVFNKTTLSDLANIKNFKTINISHDIIRAGIQERMDTVRLQGVTVNMPPVPDNRELLEETVDQLKQLNKKPVMIIQNNNAIETTAWYWQHFKN